MLVQLISPGNITITRKRGLFTIEAWDNDQLIVIPLGDAEADYLRRELAQTIDTLDAAIALEGADGDYVKQQQALRYGVL